MKDEVSQVERIRELEQFAHERGLLYRSDTPPDGSFFACVYSPDWPDPSYRYAFARCWRASGPLILWVGLNPAKGDTEKRRRPTLERCVRWSQERGAAGLLIGNLFAARHNKPKGLSETGDPIGEHNDDALRVMTSMAVQTVVAWGNDGQRHGRAQQVAGVLRDPVCFGRTSTGQPRHPLYVRHDTPLEPWSPRGRRTSVCS